MTRNFFFLLFLLLYSAYALVDFNSIAPKKNIIVMIPDGCGISHFTLSRWVKGAPLACDSLNMASVQTHSANSIITASCAAATAFATGRKTQSGYIGMMPEAYTVPNITLPENLKNAPVATVLEAARLSGRATGIVATATTSHATPAAFTSHHHSRNNEVLLMKQQVYSGVDIVLGGGRQFLLPKDVGGARIVGENLIDSLLGMGYGLAESMDGLLNLVTKSTPKRFWCHFTLGPLGYDWNRKLPQWEKEPSLQEMATTAVNFLSKSEKGKKNGFFLMIEGSQVDWASHSNEPLGVVSEYLAFDKAVSAIMSFARSDTNTLVLVVSDHDNGGLSIGASGGDYANTTPNRLLSSPLKEAKVTPLGIASMLKNSDEENIKTTVEKYLRITDLTKEEIEDISKAKNIEIALGKIISKRCNIGWTTTGHTGSDVPLYYYGIDSHFGNIDNTDIAKICAKAMEVNLDTVTNRLFQKSSELFSNMKTTLDTNGLNNGGGSLTVSKGKIRAVFYFNTNYALVNKSKKELPGLIVYSHKGAEVYLPVAAKEIFQ